MYIHVGIMPNARWNKQLTMGYFALSVVFLLSFMSVYSTYSTFGTKPLVGINVFGLCLDTQVYVIPYSLLSEHNIKISFKISCCWPQSLFIYFEKIIICINLMLLATKLFIYQRSKLLYFHTE